ncbi:MAG: flavin reductase family protein [Saprospiraceae bacterium]|nr:flavin reductase family protein [Saprospiraceae bacterium]
MRTINPSETSTKDLHQYLLGSVSPRPIAFVSTMSEDGIPNIAPYSFFNCFSSNPPILVFSSNRRVSNNTTKDTLANVQHSGEVVINVVSHSIVRQMAVTSVDFDTGVNEFEKSGLTPIPSELVSPHRIAESPVQMECKVQNIIPLGKEGGAGHLVICIVLRMHINEEVLDEDGKIDPHKIDLMGRMGRAFYVRASGDAVHKILQSVPEIVIGYDALPDHVKSSTTLSGNNLGQLAGLKKWPSEEEAEKFCQEKPWLDLLEGIGGYSSLELEVKKMLDEKDARIEASHLLQKGYATLR